MKKQIIAYADLETTTVDTSKYKSLKEYYAKEPDPKYPEIYSWCISFTSNHDKIYNDVELNRMNVLYEVNKLHKYSFNTYFGISGQSFIEFIKNINVDFKIYFNNSKSFDSHFILSELLANGFNTTFDLDIIDKIEDEDAKQMYISLKEKRVSYLNKFYKANKYYREASNEKKRLFIKSNWDNLIKNEFRMTVNKNNQIYSMGIASDKCYWSAGVKRHRNIQIWDSLLMFTTSIKKMGEDIAKYFYHKDNKEKLDYDYYEKTFCKEEISYKRYELYKDLNEFVNDGNEKHYLMKDVLILAVFHILMEKYLPRNQWKLTAASTSYSNFLKEYANHYLPKYIKKNIVKKINVKNGGYKYVYRNQKRQYSEKGIGKVIFDKMFPTKFLDKAHREYPSIHSFLYQWYSGGISKVNEKFRGMLVKRLMIADINSSYPNAMNSNHMCPYGEGVEGNKEGYDFKMYTMYVLKDIENKKGLPFLYSITDEKREWKKILKEGDVVKLTTPEYDKFLKYYNPSEGSYLLKVEWSFQTIPMKKIFGMYIDKWYPLKKQASRDRDTVLKAIVKLFLNALYGKFGTKSILESKVYNSFTNTWTPVTERIKSKYYLPIAIAITTYCRLALVDGVGENYENFVYCDTDSIFMVNKDECKFDIEFDKDKLGAWDIEAENLMGLARRPKQYYFIKTDPDLNPIIKDGKQIKKVAFAGINFNRDWLSDEESFIEEEADNIIDKLTMSDFIVGKEINNQLQPFRIVGKGIILYESIKSINPIWQYKKMNEQFRYREKDFDETLREINKLKI